MSRIEKNKTEQNEQKKYEKKQLYKITYIWNVGQNENCAAKNLAISM